MLAAAVEQRRNVAGGRTWLINPVIIAGISAPATYVLGDLAALTFSIERLAEPRRGQFTESIGAFEYSVARLIHRKLRR